MDDITSVVSKFVSGYERPNMHGVRSLMTSSRSCSCESRTTALFQGDDAHTEQETQVRRARFAHPRLAPIGSYCLCMWCVINCAGILRQYAVCRGVAKGVYSWPKTPLLAKNGRGSCGKAPALTYHSRLNVSLCMQGEYTPCNRHSGIWVA